MISRKTILSILPALLCHTVVAHAFEHPGVIVSKDDISFVKDKISNQAEPWLSSYNTMLANPLAALNYTPNAQWDSMACGGPDGEGLNSRCTHERSDARAAYTQALAWAYSGKEVYAENAIKIMNAWANQFTGHHSGQNQALQAAWAAAVWARAAEIIKYTYIKNGESAWGKSDADRFGNMLRERYIADINKQKTNCHFGNWQAVITEAKINTAVYLDDNTLFNEAIGRFKDYFPTYVYTYNDGALPVPIAGCYSHDRLDEFKGYWSIPKKDTPLLQGHAQETCRDIEHLAYGIAGFTNTAQTAYIQGIDLFQLEQDRFISMMEFNAPFDMKGDTLLKQQCGVATPVYGGLKGSMHIAYNHFSKDNEISMPNTKAWMSENGQIRPEGFFHYLWESLTHTRSPDSSK